MKKVAFAIYRKWAFDIYEDVSAYIEKNDDCVCTLLITTPEHEFVLPETTKDFEVVVCEGSDYASMQTSLTEHEIDVVFFYGWSWIVREPILSEYICLCLHPSKLPNYRGGSPIQNQIIAGERTSAVSAFKMEEGIDDGDIYQQRGMSLDGTLDQIFERMTILGSVITQQFIEDLNKNTLVFTPQESLQDFPPLKRRKAAQSEIPLESLEKTSYIVCNNIVRALADPYPNAYIVVDGRKICIQEIEKHATVPEGTYILNGNNSKRGAMQIESPMYIRLKDCYARITRYRLE